MESGLAATINELKGKGYTEDFNLFSGVTSEQFSNEFQIDDVFRFDDATDPSDQSVLYAISAKTGSRRGLLVDGFGSSSQQETADLVANLRRKNNRFIESKVITAEANGV